VYGRGCVPKEHEGRQFGGLIAVRSLPSVRDLTPEIWALQAHDELYGTNLLATGGLEQAYEAYDYAYEPTEAQVRPAAKEQRPDPQDEAQGTSSSHCQWGSAGSAYLIVL